MSSLAKESNILSTLSYATLKKFKSKPIFYRKFAPTLLVKIESKFHFSENLLLVGVTKN